jgi:HlyD family secretion protein
MSIFHRKAGDAAKKPLKFHVTKKKVILAVVILAAAAGGVIFWQKRTAAKNAAADASVKTATVTRQTITQTLSASGTIAPKETYSLTSMADGEVTGCYFDVGDQVTEGQVLYEIDASSMTSKLTSAQNTLTRAQTSLSDAQKDYAQAQSDFSGNTVKSPKSGYIKSVKIEAGDDVSGGTEIAEIYDDSTMEIRVPFLSIEAQQIATGSTAVLTLSDTMEQIEGQVIAVATQDETLTGGRLVRYVTIRVSNPGGLTTSTTASAVIGSYTSASEGTFSAIVNSTIVVSSLKSSVECEEVLVHEGDHVDVGTPLFRMKASDAEDLLKTYKDAVDQAQSSVEQAQSSLDSTQEDYDNYTITAPISGTVVSRDVKVGDNIQNLSSSTALAVIYDLSSVTFEMDIDELDISNVSVGQKVAVTADAFEDQTFEGEVTSVSMEGTSSNGVTYYPVTVTLTDYGGLLPGMNVEGVITLDSAENVIAIPADALQRGNKVYVKDDSSTGSAAAAASGTTGENASSSVPMGFHEVDVTTGLVTDDYVEITSDNLSEGDVVYVTQSTVSTDTQQQGMPGGDMGGGPGGDQGGGNMGGGQGGGGQGGGGQGGGGQGGGGPM